MNYLLRFFSLSAFIFSIPGFVMGQAVVPMASPMPTNPAAILAIAGEKNGLDSPDLKPWHLRAVYQSFDEAGHPTDKGVFEEWWAGSKRYKRSYSGKDFTETTYVTETGTYITGETTRFPSLVKDLLVSRLLSPVPEPEKDVVLLRREQNFGTAHLDCVVLARKMSNLASAPSALFPTYCFEPDKPMLRWSGSYGKRDSLYNKLLIFQEKYLAQDLNIVESNNVSVLTAHIEDLSLLGNINDADFTPPTDAVCIDGLSPIKIEAEVLQGKLIKKVAPEYPESAKQARIEGKVVIKAEIGEDGHIHEMTVLSAPDPTLAIAAMLAVKQWLYQPYLLKGRPVRVSTEINVIYRLR